MSFSIQVPGKWILAGEHAVLRGCPALVFPLHSRGLNFQFENSDRKQNDLQLKLLGEHGGELQLLFWGVVEKACELKKVRRSELSGTVTIQSSVPVGAGLGASATVSVAVARWFEFLKIIRNSEVLEFSRSLENLFHGESSGVDVAIAMSGRPLRYVRGAEFADFVSDWKPSLFVSYCGKRGVTIECVQKVKNFLQQQPEVGAQIDREMKSAVEMAEEAFARKDTNRLKESISLAKSCFERWSLVEGQPMQHMRWLEQNGALATKPTGSGNGGYVLSLWAEPPPKEVLKFLTPCF
jgi:mevalonate kinase